MPPQMTTDVMSPALVTSLALGSYVCPHVVISQRAKMLFSVKRLFTSCSDSWSGLTWFTQSGPFSEGWGTSDEGLGQTLEPIALEEGWELWRRSAAPGWGHGGKDELTVIARLCELIPCLYSFPEWTCIRFQSVLKMWNTSKHITFQTFYTFTTM